MLATLKADPTEAPEAFGTALTISRIDPQGIAKAVADAAFEVPTDALPQYAGIEGPRGYVLIRVEGAEAGTGGNPMLASLGTELNQAWGRAEESAVLDAMREHAKVQLLPEAQDAISGAADES